MNKNDISNITRVSNGWVVRDDENNIIAVFNDDAQIAEMFAGPVNKAVSVSNNLPKITFNGQIISEVFASLLLGHKLDAIKNVRHAFRLIGVPHDGPSMGLADARDIVELMAKYIKDK